MGLDQYACVTNDINVEGEEIAYWRKHNRLQGWMDALWHSKGNVTSEEEKAQWGTSFNGQKLVLTEMDIYALELAVIGGILPKTQGFFFGADSYEYLGEGGIKYQDYEKDIKFIEAARKALKEGKTVYYQCSW
jgi:hypothetical protein